MINIWFNLHMISELRPVLYEFLKNLINMAYPYYVEAPADQTLPYIVSQGYRWCTVGHYGERRGAYFQLLGMYSQDVDS